MLTSWHLATFLVLVLFSDWSLTIGNTSATSSTRETQLKSLLYFHIPVCRLFMTPALYYTSIVTPLLMTSSVCFQDRYSTLFGTVENNGN